jgi:hypothetical protein
MYRLGHNLIVAMWLIKTVRVVDPGHFFRIWIRIPALYKYYFNLKKLILLKVIFAEIWSERLYIIQQLQNIFISQQLLTLNLGYTFPDSVLNV